MLIPSIDLQSGAVVQLRRPAVDVHDHATGLGPGEAHLDDGAFLDLVGHLVGEDPGGQGPGVDERVDRGVAAHRAERSPGVGPAALPRQASLTIREWPVEPSAHTA